MPTSSRRTRKRSARAEEAEGSVEPEAAAAPPEEDESAEKKKKPIKKKKRIDRPAAWDASSSALSSLLPDSVTSDPSSLLAHLVAEMQSLSASKKRCTDALRAIRDGRAAAPRRPEEGEGDEAARGGKRETKRRGGAERKKKGAPSLDPPDDGEEGDDSGEGGTRDAHLLMAATQGVNVLVSRLRSLAEHSKGGGGAGGVRRAKRTALLLSALSHSLIVALCNDKSLLEALTKSSQYSGGWGMESEEEGKADERRRRAASQAKAVCGRGIASAVVGCVWALESLGGSPPDDEEGGAERRLLRRGVWTCLLALETAFQMNHRPKLLMTSSAAASSGPVGGSAGAMDFDGLISAVAGGSAGGPRSWARAHAVMGGGTVSMWNGFAQRIASDHRLGFRLDEVSEEGEAENALLEEMCRETTEGAFGSEDDSMFIALVLKGREGGREGGDEPPAKKSKRAPKKKGRAESHEEELAELSSLLAQRQENHILFDCHVSVRRWSTLAFGWLCSGQRRFLEICMTMLTRKEGWKKVLEMAPTESKETTAALSAVEASSKKKKESKTKKSSVSKDVDARSAKEESGGLRGDLALVIFVSCMVDLISTGGISPSNTGWMDEYVKVITDAPDAEEPFADSKPEADSTSKAAEAEKSEEGPVRRSSRKRSKAATAKASERAAAVGEASRTSPKAGKKSSTSWVRPNVTDEVAYLTKLLIEAHTSCLQDCFQQHLIDTNSAFALKNMEAEMRRLVVNDDDSYRDSLSYRRNDSKELVNIIPFYPFMHRTLETLGRTAASSSFVSTTGTKSRILAIGGAIALSDFANQFERAKGNTEEVVVMDAKLLSLAVSELADTFTGFAKNFLATKIDSNNGSSNAGAPSELSGENAFAEVSNKYRLSEPLVIERLDKKDTDLDPRAVDAAVTYGGAFPQGDGKSGVDGSEDLWMRTDPSIHAEVMSCFIRAQCGLSLSGDVNISPIESFNKSLLSILHMCYEFPMGKQNQASDAKELSSKKKKRKANSLLSAVGQNETDVKTVTRCVLAADTLNFMRKCLAVSPEWKDSSALTKGMEFLCIRAMFRKEFSTELIKEFVDLGYLLQDKLVYPRLLQTINDASPSIPESSKVIFEPSERRLWTSHVKMGLVIARGQVAYKPQCQGSLLQDSERRLEVFQHIAEVERERHADGTHQSRTRLMEHHWPLFLPSIQHSLVSSTLSCIPAHPGSDVQAELFICNAFLNSLENVLSSGESVPRASINDNIPISLRDARLFTLAAAKLDREQQKFVFLRLVELLQMGAAAANDTTPLEIETIRLLARGICLAAHVADVVTSTGLEMALAGEVGSAHYNMPKITRRMTPEQERTCCNKEVAYMGLFDDCRSPAVPATGVSSTTELLEDAEFEKITDLVKTSLELGFRVSAKDGGHLLFSAWNAAGKLCSWTPDCWEGPSTAAIIKKQDILDRLINLRDTMCEVSILMSPNEPSSQQQTLLVTATSNKKGRCRPNEALLTGITSCEKMIGHLASELGKAPVSAEPPSLPTFAYFEALPVYVSFLISMHTRPGSNNFSSIHRFSKSHVRQNKPIAGYTEEDVIDEFPSDDSDHETSNDTGVQSLRNRAFSRLKSACSSLGAAPCWPDWLDTGCRMQAVVPPVAVDSADRALSSLTDFGLAVFKCYSQALQQVLDIANKSSHISTHLLHQLVASQQQSPFASEYGSFYSRLSGMGQIDMAIVKSAIRNGNTLPYNSFMPHSSQRIVGADAPVGQDSSFGELRANEQWEMILSYVIRGSALRVHSVLLATEDSPALTEALEVVNRWKRVLYSVVSAMVPTAALLRFAIYDAKGRSPHPLCSDCPERPMSSTETVVASRFSTNNEVGANMKKALAFLSHVSTVDDPLRLTSQAAANHLLENPAQVQFSDLVAAWSVQVCCDALLGLHSLCVQTEKTSESASAAAYALIELILKQICNTQSNDNDTVPKEVKTFLASFGLEGILQTRLIGDSDTIEVANILSQENKHYYFTTERKDIARLLLMLLASKEQTPRRLRLLVGKTLSDFISHEEKLLEGMCSTSDSGLFLAAATALDEMSKDDVRVLLSNMHTSDPTEHEITEHLVSIISTLATVEHTSLSGKGCKMILREMTEGINQLACCPIQSSVTNLICTLASRFGTLEKIGTTILSLAMRDSDNSDLTSCIQRFFKFVVGLEEMVHPESNEETNTSSGGQGKMTKQRGIQRRTCTYTQTGEGFANQHWYNCYTCGLLWDKGCCSLCARVCHKDHDVGYSRKSSFFCDCGAEASARKKCKCLTPIDDKTFNALQDEPNEGAEPGQLDCGNPAEKVFNSFPAECISSLQLLVKEARASKWSDTILKLFEHSFKSMAGSFDFSTLLDGPPALSVNDNGKPSLDLRCGVPLNMRFLDAGPSMVPIRAAKANSVKVGMLPTLSAMRRNRAERQIIDCDIRGRMVCAEQNALLFFTSIPAINIRHVDTPCSSHISRSQLIILGGEKIKFDIHGLALSPESQSLVAWGASEACVTVLSKGFDSIKRTIKLQIDAEPECESEYLLGLLWLTETIVVGICGTVVHVFDLATTGNDESCKATAHYALAYEDVLIRSAVLTSNLSCTREVHKKLCLLLDSGRLHFIDLYVDNDGNFEDEGETYIEVGSGTSFPSAGIRRYCGGEPSTAGSTSTTLGEGSTLHFLHQSNLLLYQCVSSPCVAMIIDKNGAVSGTFELLPTTISSDNVPGSQLGLVAGPYLHFQELGTVRRGGEVYYRVTCVGRSTSSNQPRILVVEFNQSSVFVRELLWPPSFSAGLGSMASNSFIGSCAFSVPYPVGGTSSQGMIDSNTEVYERAFLTMLSSTGSIFWFGEDCDPIAPKQTDQPKVKAISNTYMFEEPSIINVSEDDNLIFAGECAVKDPKTTKKKLSLNNSEFMTSNSREGYTLTARLDSNETRKGDAGDLAIVAVRVLVGSMPELIPREISIMGSGRTIKTKRNTKRWYDFVLTDEEVLLAIRNGFVSVYFSPSYDLSSGAVVDAVEVYAKVRADPESDSTTANNNGSLMWQPDYKKEESNHVSCIQSLVFLAKILGEDKASFLSSNNSDVMKQILEKTALDSSEHGPEGETLRSSTLTLLKEVEHDEFERSRFVDNSTLRGLMTTLMGLGSFLKDDVPSMSAGQTLVKKEAVIHHAIQLLLQIIKASSDIARTNGNNYKAAITSLIKDGTSRASIAIEAKRIVDYAAHLSLSYGSTVSFAQVTHHLSDLILMEIACTNDDAKDYAQFETLSEYLLHEDSSIVEACCEAVATMSTDTPKPQQIIEDTYSQDNPNAFVSYQCDACKMFPIKDMRYTIGGEVDIDLCKDCFERGCTYATSHEPGTPLVIHGRTLCVEDEDMPCDSIWQMKGIAIAAPTVEDVEAVEAALKMSQPTKEHTACTGAVDREEFTAQIFTNLLELITKSFETKDSIPSHLINLVLTIIITSSKSEKLKIARGQEMLKKLIECLRKLLGDCDVHIGKMITCLQALSSLVTKKTSLDQVQVCLPVVRSVRKDKDAKSHHHKDKTDPRFVCDAHKVPAVRRRCSHGVHKDRRFYVCGLERKNRCNYFKWADNPGTNSADKHNDSEDHRSPSVEDQKQTIFEPIQIELTKMLGESIEGSSIQMQFCELISKQFEMLKDSTTELDTKESTIAAARPKFAFSRSEDDVKRDIRDGVLLSRRKLGKVESLPAVKNTVTPESSTGASSLISESLFLFSLVASSQKWGSDSHWFPVLCAIISTGGSSVLRHLAKKFLQQLCGGRQDLYHRIRDHYVYGYQFRKLLRQSEGVLDNALISREMARQCGANWRDDEVEFKTLHPAGLFGVGDLISEDSFSVAYEQNVQLILDELLSTAGTNARRSNWRNFCALSEIPADNTPVKGTSSSNGSILDQLAHRPPIMSLLWLSSCLRGSNQVKMFRLMDIALADIKRDEPSSSTDEDDAKIGEGLVRDCGQMSPEQTLTHLTVVDLHAFIVEFIVNGRCDELRRVAGSVVAKLASRLSDADKNALFGKLVDGLFRNVVGKFGCVSKEFIVLLKFFVQNFGLDLSKVASCITSAFVLQMTTTNHNTIKTCGTDEKESINFDTANCAHCQNQNTGNGKKSSSESCTSKGSEGWVDEQLRPCVKSRLESSTLASASSEYSSYVQLKFRVVLSEVHVSVSDPRGRLVKNIGVYFSPRPFNDVNMLKNDKYANLWQRCGTLSLARHATTATLKLKRPVVAANLKFTYEDFYEKVGGGCRAPDGSFILHCPRCTRQVNNAHGVCGNCGEVAFQCRKCRHINYDRLDAFLCVECGYCTSGGFSYDITVGMALNAVAILDEDGYQRSISMLRIASKRHSELKNSLKKKMFVFSQQQSKLNGQDEHIEEMVLYGPHLKRALLGRLPKMNDESEAKTGSSSQLSSSSARQDSSRSLAANRARSLISLARQLRADGSALGGDSDRLSRSELLIQQALLASGSAGASSDILDELNETVFGALSGGSAADHSLSRAIASLQERNQTRSSRTETGAGAAGEGTARSGVKDDKKSTPFEECSRIYLQMREAERECYELTRRIEAWNCLNQDSLAAMGPRFPFRTPFTFFQTSCSVCGPQISLSLMSLLLAVFETNISQSEHTVSGDLVKLLLTESSNMNVELKNLKRKAVIELASTSETASEIILAEIKTRLTAVQDVTSAEVLGQIVQLDFPSVQKYIDLAVSVLQDGNI